MLSTKKVRPRIIQKNITFLCSIRYPSRKCRISRICLDSINSRGSKNDTRLQTNALTTAKHKFDILITWFIKAPSCSYSTYNRIPGRRSEERTQIVAAFSRTSIKIRILQLQKVFIGKFSCSFEQLIEVVV